MQRTFKDYFIIGLKGLSMGAADAIPGISGGTIALISGIYNELLSTISSINISALKLLYKKEYKTFWKHINGNFILALFIGIAISFVGVLQLARYLLTYHPLKIWAFFFGLILASIPLVWKGINKWNPVTILAMLVGVVIAYYITLLPALATNSGSLFLFLAASLAICAMILPGISGSFILVIIGAYKPLSDAVHHLDIKRILIFIAGAVIGLLSFSRLLKWLLNKYYNTTLAVLTGFIIGSLNKIWPWKQTLSVINQDSGIISNFNTISPLGTLSVYELQNNVFNSFKVISEQSILPQQYVKLNNVSAETPVVIGLMLAGFLLIFILERIGQSIK